MPTALDHSSPDVSAAPPLPAVLVRALARAHESGFLRRFTLVNRLLLAFAFTPSGLVKLCGERFTTLPVDNPIGFFFEAMYRTGVYWHFLGFVQVTAAILLLIPRTATLGAVLFLPVAVNIFLITYGIGFGGTVWVTGGMLLAVTYLICWDLDKIAAALRPLFRTRVTRRLLQGMHTVELAGWLAGGLAGLGCVLATRGFVPMPVVPALLIVGAAAAALVLVGWLLGHRRSRQPAAAPPSPSSS